MYQLRFTQDNTRVRSTEAVGHSSPAARPTSPLRLSRRTWMERRFDIFRPKHTMFGKAKADPLLGPIETVTGIA